MTTDTKAAAPRPSTASERDWPAFMERLAQLIPGALDASALRRVRFHGEEYVITSGGAIAKPDDYEAGRCSFAHLYDDGQIFRFGEVIGTTADLETVSERGTATEGSP